MGQFLLDAGNADVNPALLAWVKAAAEQSPYNVRLQSGYREGDPRFHGQKKAIDVQLIDPRTNKVIPNYQNAESFKAYQGFANTVRLAQNQMNPELANNLRWGGYFSGPKGNYGSMDLMHFDVGGDTVPMGGGGWETGLTDAQAKLWGLSPGGGVSGGAVSGPNSAPLAGVFDGAEVIASETPGQKMASAFAKGVSKMGDSAPQASNTMIGDAVPETPTVSLETPSAVPQQRSLETPGGNLVDTSSSLADLFQVRDIGTPLPQIGKARYTPTRRGF